MGHVAVNVVSTFGASVTLRMIDLLVRVRRDRYEYGHIEKEDK